MSNFKTEEQKNIKFRLLCLKQKRNMSLCSYVQNKKEYVFMFLCLKQKDYVFMFLCLKQKRLCLYVQKSKNHV